MPGFIPPNEIVKMVGKPKAKPTPKPTAKQSARAKAIITNADPLTRLTRGDLKKNSSTGQYTTQKDRVKQVQQILVNHGYRLKVDGVEGPETKSALDDFHSAKPNSKAWNGGHSASGASLGLDPAKVGAFAPGGSKTDPVEPATTTDSSAGGTGITPAQLQKLMGNAGGISASKYTVDPGKYAQAQVDEQYGPQIAQANQTISDATHQAGVNLDDLTKWYGDASGLAKTGAVQSKKDDQAAITDHTAASRAILAAFGGDAGTGGQSIDNTAQNGNNLLAATMSNHSAFNDMLQGLISDQGATAKATQNQKDQTNIGDMKAALTALIAQKASALTADTAGAKQQNLSNLINITQSNNSSRAAKLNELITMAELPSTIAANNLKTTKTIADINKANAGAAKASVPKNFFVNASANDLNNAKAAIVAATKGKGYNPKQAIAAAIAAQPWKVNTPGVASRVVIPALTLAGYGGITPGMLGITG